MVTPFWPSSSTAPRGRCAWTRAESVFLCGGAVAAERENATSHSTRSLVVMSCIGMRVSTERRCGGRWPSLVQGVMGQSRYQYRSRGAPLHRFYPRHGLEAGGQRQIYGKHNSHAFLGQVLQYNIWLRWKLETQQVRDHKTLTC